MVPESLRQHTRKGEEGACCLFFLTDTLTHICVLTHREKKKKRRKFGIAIYIYIYFHSSPPGVAIYSVPATALWVDFPWNRAEITDHWRPKGSRCNHYGILAGALSVGKFLPLLGRSFESVVIAEPKMNWQRKSLGQEHFTRSRVVGSKQSLTAVSTLPFFLCLWWLVSVRLSSVSSTSHT